MTLQTSVLATTGYGVPGEIADDAPYAASSFTINSADQTLNNIGFVACTQNGTEGQVEAGGTGVFAGYLAQPKEHALYGTAGNTLAASTNITNGNTAAILYEGNIWVGITNAATVGDTIVYDTTDGTLSAVTPGAALPAGTAFGFARVSEYNVAAPSGGATYSLAKIQVNFFAGLPTLALSAKSKNKEEQTALGAK